MRNIKEFEYKGFKYVPELDIEPEENCKIMHDVKGPNGLLMSINYSPYSVMPENLFKFWVDNYIEIKKIFSK